MTIQQRNLFMHRSLDLPRLDNIPITELPSVKQYSETLQDGLQTIHQAFENGSPASDLIVMRSMLVDRVILDFWKRISSRSLQSLISITAVGGYGRQELLPHSDIDLLLIVEQSNHPELNETISQLITFLWDIGLDVGHSVRTISECVSEAIADVTVITNLMESRLLVGSAVLYEKMLEVTSSQRIWPANRFFIAKVDEQKTRYKKYIDSGYRLEPNIKESPGGLRNIQIILWVTKRQFDVLDIKELFDHNFITLDELQKLTNGQEYLWKIRYLLHHFAGRDENRLLFNYQREIAAALGFCGEGNEAIEQFMQRYYRTVMSIERLNEMLIQLFHEALLFSDNTGVIQKINPRFQIRNDYIEVTSDNVFEKTPSALIEIFLMLTKNPSIKGIRAHTIRLIRENLHLIDDPFRNDAHVTSLFMELFRLPFGITQQLRRMNRYGVLAAYLPAFQNIVGRMQYDLFHIYTVDEHILMVLRHMRRFVFEEHKHELPMCSDIMANIPRKEILYLACLFHDIAKGRNGDHSVLGVEDVRIFGQQHGLSNKDTHLISWLVRNHLIMSITAQSKDISDPKVINEFAAKIGTIKYLQHLYLLTCADIQGTNPELWTSWKGNLLAELYQATLNVLKRGLSNPVDKSEIVARSKQAALHLLDECSVSEETTHHVWQDFGQDYFLRYQPDEICWQTQVVLKHHQLDIPLIVLRKETIRGCTEIFIYTRDSDALFLIVTTVLDNLGLNIVNARIITSQAGHTLDTFLVIDEEGQAITDAYKLREIRESLQAALEDDSSLPELVNKSIPRQLKHFENLNKVTLDNNIRPGVTAINVSALDQPGLLSILSRCLVDEKLRVHDAMISTLGERVEDIFFVTERDLKPIDSQTRRLHIQTHIQTTLDAI